MKRYGYESIFNKIRYKLGITPKLSFRLESYEIKAEPRRIKCEWSKETEVLILIPIKKYHIIVNGKKVVV